MMSRLYVILPLWALYLLLSGNLSWNNVIIGGVVAILVTWLVRPPSRPLPLRTWPLIVWGLIRYLLTLVVDIVISGIQVARIVLDPKLPIEPGIVAIPVHDKSEAVQVLSAHAITVTPGEMVVEIGEDGTMYTHTLDVNKTVAAMDEAQQKREASFRRMLT